MKLTKKISAVFLITCLLFQSGGALYLFDFILEKIKEESRLLILNEKDIPENNITQIIVSKNNPDNSIIIENNEIEMKGMKYDIISKTEDENNTYYRVYCDVKESEFIANAKSGLDKTEKSNQHSRNVIQQNTIPVIGILNDNTSLHIYENFNIYKILNTSFYISYISDHTTPPPKNI
jgi:hypothetical protein